MCNRGMTTLIQFSSVTLDRCTKGYTLGSGKTSQLRWAHPGERKMTRILNVIRAAADQNPNSVNVEPCENGVTVLRTNLNGTYYVLWVH
jgi:hypothetical protein